MADTRTAPGVDRRPLISYLRVQRDVDREMVAALTRSSDRIKRELRYLESRVGIGAAVRRDQLLLTQASIQREVGELWSGLGRTIQAGKANAAAAAIEGMHPTSALKLVLPAGDVDYLLRSAQASARQHADTLAARLGLSKVPLAESVYKNKELTSGKIDDIVNSALARGASARELANDVSRFVRPDVRGGVRYSALRLGRTELNNAFHAQQVQSAIETPWTTGLRWEISGSHPKPDECDDYAEASPYKPADVPPKPHPNCLCFTTPEVVSREDFIKQFEAGQYDEYLDSMDVPTAASRAPSASAKARTSVPAKTATTTDEAAQKLSNLPSLPGTRHSAEEFAKAAANRAKYAKQGATEKKVADVVSKWTATSQKSVSEVRAQILRGELDDVVAAARNGTEAPTLYRSIKGVPGSEVSKMIDNLKIGDVTDMRGLSSFTSDADWAKLFTGSRSGKSSISFELKGARGLDISKISNSPGEKEWLVTGQMRVTKILERTVVKLDDGSTAVHLRVEARWI